MQQLQRGMFCDKHGCKNWDMVVSKAEGHRRESMIGVIEQIQLGLGGKRFVGIMEWVEIEREWSTRG